MNTYVGNYYGVLLGYAGNTGFGTYGLPGAERNRLRGARVFELDESADGVLAETRMVFAADLGIDLTADDRPIAPAPLPRR